MESVEAEFKNKELPAFRPGDTVKVNFRIVEGNKERIQAFEGLLLRIHRNGASSTFTVRKMVGDIGVERIFPFYSPRVESVEVKRTGRVRQARLYYMRALRGKAARIKERRKGF
nr:50S ribosomal protein L19 [Limisalsivibrio acetivorans]